MIFVLCFHVHSKFLNMLNINHAWCLFSQCCLQYVYENFWIYQVHLNLCKFDLRIGNCFDINVYGQATPFPLPIYRYKNNHKNPYRSSYLLRDLSWKYWDVRVMAQPAYKKRALLCYREFMANKFANDFQALPSSYHDCAVVKKKNAGSVCR